MLAQEESRLLNHSYIGTEHLLLGLTREGDGVAARALAGLGVELMAVRAAVEAKVVPGPGTPEGHIPFTPRAKKAMELSLREALRLGHNYIGTEHLLLGLTAVDDGVAGRVLADMGLEPAAVREKVVEILGTFATTGAPAGAPPPPLCPSCRANLGGRLWTATLDATDNAGAVSARALVLYCGSCGRTIGVLPAS